MPRLKWHQLRRRKSDPAFLRENLDAALHEGAACEVDLALTADGHAFCLHDPELDRETTGSGPAARATRAQVERLRQRAPDGQALASPPLFLDEIVAAVRRAGARRPGLVQLDVKVAGDSLDGAAAARIGATLGAAAPAFVVGGCEWEAVARLVAAAPGLRAGFDPLALYPRGLPQDAAGFRALGERSFAIAPAASLFYLEARLVLAGLDRGVNLIDIVARDGAETDMWTLDADHPDLRRDLGRLIRAGCHQITSNDPDALRAVVEEIAACS